MPDSHFFSAAPQTDVVACHDCDLLFPRPRLRKGERAVCPRCGADLFENKGHTLDYSLALVLTSFILFVIANINTLLVMKIGGLAQAGAIISGVHELYVQGYWQIAILVFVVSILAPLLKLLCLFYILLPLRFGFKLPGANKIFGFYETLHPWAMTEVYMLGILVAVVKLADLASIEPGIALYSFVALIVFMAATDASLDDHELWDRLGWVRKPAAKATQAKGVHLLCHTCHMLSRSTNAHPQCARCGSPLHKRKPNSLARTWALTLTAYILYIPANLLPVMTVTMSGHGEPDTILSGVKELALGGMWPLALLVFFASVTVPVLKLLVLTYLLLSVQFKSTWRPRERTVLYRITETVGRWSMIDIFVIAILVALVKLGALATIEAGDGAIAFGGVVVITMFAAMSFDPRLIWASIPHQHSADSAHHHPLTKEGGGTLDSNHLTAPPEGGDFSTARQSHE